MSAQVVLDEFAGKPDATADQVAEGSTEHTDAQYTINEAIEYCGFGRFQITMLFITGAAWMADAMEVFLISFITPTLSKAWNLNAVTPFMVSSSFLVIIVTTLSNFSKGIFYWCFYMGTSK
jgi:hypothetical protein